MSNDVTVNEVTDIYWSRAMQHVQDMRAEIEKEVGDAPWVWGSIPIDSREEFLEQMGRIWDNTEGDKADEHFLFVEDETRCRIMATCGVGPSRERLAQFIHASVMLTKIILDEAKERGEIV